MNTISNPFFRAYDINCRKIVPDADAQKLPFGAMECVVKPGETSRIHNHHEHECFFITQGSGVMSQESEQTRVSAGDAIQIAPFADHELHNPSTDEDLRFVTIWWEDLREAAVRAARSKSSRRTLIISTPPTPNGDLHLGHLSGPYTGADIYRRFLESKQLQALHITGRDDNQSYVPRKAGDQGRSPVELADDYSDRMENALKRSAIRIDHYAHPGKSPYHVSLVSRVVTELHAKGFIYEKAAESLFCRATGRYLHEAHVRGLCPHCNAESDGNACEQCGRPNDVVDLIEPVSKFGNAGVEKRVTKKLYFRLSAFQKELKLYIAQVTMPAHLAGLCHNMLDAGLPDICISHLTDWGIEVPFPGFEDQRIYVWFEMAAGYLAAARETSEKFGLATAEDQSWRALFANEETDVVHFFGFDNGYYHALLFPAIYMALGWGIKLPSAFVVNELLNLDGQKFSTSRNHLIWGTDLLRFVPSDYMRFYLSLVRPETSKTNFRLSEFTDIVNQTLAGEWNAYLERVFQSLQENFQGIVPAPGAWTREQRAFFARVDALVGEAESGYRTDDFSPQRACETAIELIREARRFSESHAHLVRASSSFDFLRTGTALELRTAGALAIIIHPVMPDFARTLWEVLGANGNIAWPEEIPFVREGTVITPAGKPFFQLITNDVLGLQTK